MATDGRRRDLHVLVLGGSGFIGRHVVEALLAQNAHVTIGTRHPQQWKTGLCNTLDRCPRIQTRFECLTDTSDWSSVLEGVDTVVNAVGILRQRPGETYDIIHHRAPVALAACCKNLGVTLVHVSALGLDANVTSRFLLSKRKGDRAIQRTGGNWFIVRPSLVDGSRGYGARWIRAVSNWPVHVLPANAVGRIAALDARELGQAIAALALRPGCSETRSLPRQERIYELGGHEAFVLGSYLNAMRQREAPPLRFSLPAPIARALSHLCDLLHVTPYSFGHYQLLQKDNLPIPNRFQELLGHRPRKIGRGIKSGRPVADPVR